MLLRVCCPKTWPFWYRSVRIKDIKAAQTARRKHRAMGAPTEKLRIFNTHCGKSRNFLSLEIFSWKQYSRTLCPKNVRVNLCNFHTVQHCTPRSQRWTNESEMDMESLFGVPHVRHARFWWWWKVLRVEDIYCV